MPLKRCKGRRRSWILSLLVIVSISFAVLAALAALLPAVSADTDGTVTTDAVVSHGEIDINKYAKTSGIGFDSYRTTRVTLTVNGSEDILDTSAYHVLSDDVEYAGNATIEANDTIGGNTLRWDIGDLASGTPWTVSFDVRPKRMGKDLPANEVPFSMAIYELETPEETKKVTAGGCWILSPANSTKKATFGFVVQHKKGKESPEGELEFQDHATGMNLHSESIEELEASEGNSTVFGGNATVNGETGYNFTVFAKDSESGNEFMILIGGPGDFHYKANGTLNGGTIKVHSGSSGMSEFPQVSVDLIGISLKDVNVSVPPKERVIGESVPVTGYAVIKNTGSEANVSVKLCVDGYPLSRDSVPIVVDEEEEIMVSTPWIPMSSGRHSISIHVHGLKDDGTEFWTEAQGSENSKTTNKITYMKKVVS